MKYTRDLSTYHKNLAMSIFFTILCSFCVCVLCALPWDYCTNKMYGRYCDGDGVYLTVWMVVSCVVMG